MTTIKMLLTSKVYDPLAETHFVELPLRHYQGDLGERCNTSIIMGWGSRVSNVASPLAGN